MQTRSLLTIQMDIVRYEFSVKILLSTSVNEFD